MARLEVALGELCDHKSGDSARKMLGLDEAADSGRGIGLNSFAFALSNRGDDNGDAGRLAVYCA